MKKDDCSVDDGQLRQIRKRAHDLLLRSGAYGRFPTPVDDLVSAAKLSIEREVSLDRNFLGRLYRRLVPPAMKRAVDKVLAVIDFRDRRIYLDKTVHKKKQVFVSIHDVGHEYLDWQREIYQLVEDGKMSIDHDVQETFEREANTFACEVLFQLDGFTREAADHSFGIKTPVELAKKYGPSVYASIRRYVTKSDRACVVLVFDGPVHEAGVGDTLSLRRVAVSPRFGPLFGHVKWPQKCRPESFFVRHCPKRWMTGPHPCQLADASGRTHSFVAEAFNSTHEVFFLLCPVAELGKARLKVAV